jgi:hypothetical protein
MPEIIDRRAIILTQFPTGNMRNSRQSVEVTCSDSTLTGFLRKASGQIPKNSIRSTAKAVMELVSDSLKFDFERELSIHVSWIQCNGYKLPVKLGEFISEGVGVCVERSILSQVTLSYLGVKSSLACAFAKKEHVGKLFGHFWVELKDENGISFVLDPNDGLRSLERAYMHYEIPEKRLIALRQEISRPLHELLRSAS